MSITTLRAGHGNEQLSRLLRSGVVVSVAAVLWALAGVPEAVAKEQAQAAPSRGKDVMERQEEREKGDEYKAIGARIGSFQLFPSLEIDGLYYSNVFATQENAQSDVLTRIRPQLLLKSDWNRHKLALKFKPEVIRYYRFSDDNVENYDFIGAGRIDVLKALKANVRASYKLGNEDRGDPNAVAAARAPTETKTTKAHIDVDYKPAWVSLNVGADFTDNDFKDATNRDASITNNDDRDRDKKEITVRLGREYLPDTEMFVKASYNIIDYNDAVDDAGTDRDSKGYSVVLGTDLDFTGIVTGNVFGGYIRQTYDDIALEPIAGPTAGASVKWNVTPLATVKGALTRDINETTTGNSPGFLSTAASFRVDYEILRQWTARAKIKATNQDYESIARRDRLLDFTIQSRYLFNRNYAAELKYGFKRKTSSAAGSSYTRQSVRLQGRAQF